MLDFFSYVYIAIALGGATICGLYDLKTTNMLDRLAIAMIALGFGLHAVESLLTGSVMPIVLSLAAAGAFFAFGFFMYKAGYWGGGDGEILIAIGALMPYAPFQAALSPLSLSFSLDFFMNSFIVGGFYSIVYAGVIGIMNRKVLAEFSRKMKAEAKSTFMLVAGTFLVLWSVLYLFPANGLRFFPVLMSVLLFFMLALFKFAKVVEDVGFYRRIPVSKLKVDDMVGEDLPKLKIYKKIIRGLTPKEVAMIRKAKKYVIVREGVRYSIVFALALAFTLLFGNFANFMIMFL
ncbi:MAG: prepilin peptidase [Candidatus Aenigmatarchaeota archaeon]